LADITIEQGMDIMTSLLKDKNGKLIVQVKTNYPGVKFTSITGADIMQTTPKKTLRTFRKQFGLGLNIGYGAVLLPTESKFEVRYGPTISVGLNWSPKILQFGK